MPSFSKMSNVELEKWLDGTNAQIDSPAYKGAKQEKLNRQFQSFIETLNNLKETWKDKLFWVVIVALIVEILGGILSGFVLKYIK